MFQKGLESMAGKITNQRAPFEAQITLMACKFILSDQYGRGLESMI